MDGCEQKGRLNGRFHRVLKTAMNNDEQWLGGEGGIRTHDTVARMPHFECGAFNRSATSPRPTGRGPRSEGRYVAKAGQGDKAERSRRAMCAPVNLRFTAAAVAAEWLRSLKMHDGE